MLKTTGRHADILEVIADLSNDEVFTPPRVARDVLDLLPAAVWADPALRWLDPGSKTGIFLREITRRLYEGLAPVIPNDAARLDHILRHQVFGVATSALTALMSRRTLYCAMTTHGTHSVLANAPAAGHVWHQRIEHAYNEAGRCTECGGARDQLEATPDSENNAYPFIHAAGRAALAQEFDMKFDVIVGNPPYQMQTGTTSKQARPLYNLFVEQALALNPRYITMVIPSRWTVGGMGLDEFRATMLGDRRITHLVDHPVASDIFPSVDIKGGICYFLWDREADGECEVTTKRGNNVTGPRPRRLNEFDVLVRDEPAIQILRKVLAASSGEESFSQLVSPQRPFGFPSNYMGQPEEPEEGEGGVVLYRAGGPTWTTRDEITMGHQLIDEWKVLLPKAGPGNSGGHVLPDPVLSRSIVAGPNTCCTETYVVAGPVTSLDEANSLDSYTTTRFVRFLVSLRKTSQDALRSVYTWVPQQTWDREWTDEVLYAKYGITDEEQAYIASMIREMN